MENRGNFIKAAAAVAVVGGIVAPCLFLEKTIAANETATSKDRFDNSSPLGINVDDIPTLNAMHEQKLLGTGFPDVTRQPFNADPTGKIGSTKAIADAVSFGRHNKLAVYFPTGEYLVSDTITCVGGLSDERTPNHKYLPFAEVWPCVLIGEQRGKERPVIILAPGSVGFNDPIKPKVVLDFFTRDYHRETKNGPHIRAEGLQSYNQLLRGIDIRIGPGNPGAAAVSFDASEGSTLQDATFDVSDGFTGILGGDD